MTPLQRLQAAIDKLEALKASSHNWRIPVTLDEEGPQVIHDFDTEGHGPGSGPLAWTTSDEAAENIVTLHRTIDAQLAILRSSIEWFEKGEAEWSAEMWQKRPTLSKALQNLLRQELALADAILGIPALADGEADRG